MHSFNEHDRVSELGITQPRKAHAQDCMRLEILQGPLRLRVNVQKSVPPWRELFSCQRVLDWDFGDVVFADVSMWLSVINLFARVFSDLGQNIAIILAEISVQRV